MGKFATLIARYTSSIPKLVDITNPKVMEHFRQEDPLLATYYEIKDYSDFDLLWLKTREVPSVASVLGFEGEVPNTRGLVGLEQGSLGRFKIGVAHTYTENDLILMNKFENSNNPRFIQDFKDRIFGNIEDMRPRILGMTDILTWQVNLSGGCDYFDPRSGAIARLSYPTEPALFPNALTGQAKWNQHNTADGIRNLEEHLRAFYAVHHRKPDEIAMPEFLADDLISQVSTRNYARTLTTSQTPVEDYFVDIDILQAVLKRRKIPPIRIYDRTLPVETAPNVFTPIPLLPYGYYCFLTKVPGQTGMGERAFGPLPSNDFKPGINAFPEEVSKEPPVDRLVGTATVVPAVWNSKLLAARKVCDTPQETNILQFTEIIKRSRLAVAA